MPTYRVTYTFNEKIPVQGQVREYPSLGVKLSYDNDILKQITTILWGSTPEEVQTRSMDHLRLLLEVMRFFYGLPITLATVHTEIIDQSGSSVGQVTTGVDAAICGFVTLPSESVLSNAPPSLPKWLQFANEARNKSSDAEAIKLYYNVLEDMCGRPNTKRATLQRCVLSIPGTL